MTPEEARRYVEVLDLYAGDLEALVEETRADKPGLTSALNPHLHDMARGVATVREKITADTENMTRMIAGMRTEYRAEYQAVGGRWFPTPHRCSCSSGWGTKQQAERHAADWKADGYPTRIIPRYIAEPEADQ